MSTATWTMLLRVNPLLTGAALVGVVIFLMVMAVLTSRGQTTASQRRHLRYQATAARVLARLPQLQGDAQRLNYLRKINPYVFEEILLLALSRQGLTVMCNPSYSGDGGLDGKVWIDGSRYLIQAKRYSRAINPAHVEAFAALVKRERCRGLFIHTGRTGDKSRLHCTRAGAFDFISGQPLLCLLAGGSSWRPR